LTADGGERGAIRSVRIRRNISGRTHGGLRVEDLRQKRYDIDRPRHDSIATILPLSSERFSPMGVMAPLEGGHELIGDRVLDAILRADAQIRAQTIYSRL